MKWREIKVVTKGICVEAIAGIFGRLGSGGVVIERLENSNWSDDTAPDLMPLEPVSIRGYFAHDCHINKELNEYLKRVQENFDTECQIFYAEIDDEDWEETWKAFYHPFKIGERIVIKPSWEDYRQKGTELVIDIDPGMAFGTGLHSSTRFCLQFLDKYIKGNENVFDVGCGSGILAIAASKLGAAKVLAIDKDGEATRIARENIIANKLGEKVIVLEGDIINAVPKLQFDMMVANITAEVLIELIPQAADLLPSNGYFFGSGIIDTFWESVKKQLELCGFTVLEILEEDEWVGVAARKI